MTTRGNLKSSCHVEIYTGTIVRKIADQKIVAPMSSITTGQKNSISLIEYALDGLSSGEVRFWTTLLLVYQIYMVDIPQQVLMHIMQQYA